MTASQSPTHHTCAFSDAPDDAPGARIEIRGLEADSFRASFDDGRAVLLRLVERQPLPGGGVRLVAEIDGTRHEAFVTPAANGALTLDSAGIRRSIETRGRRRRAGGSTGSPALAVILAPMPARVAEILVGEAQIVDEGAPVLRIEAMKMLMTLTAPQRCRIDAVHVALAQNVEAGARLVSLGEAPPEPE
ncbi:acetyl-CoA carboxylase biotin carboxyl carrier protein subunit [Burkholderia plantarii]|uniref:biotin/lipoyl-containing protein n=1 Tax=Burkholderia plantarii TaxID=41899 RepID=UPI00272A10DB|nr:biotin/lipoyl-containing protein [Burkholderia plantarii]WLE59316.1 acetyl-CoA carboxylase biotin carboxyl carrier protein subunit [Burkholderia plantarii]